MNPLLRVDGVTVRFGGVTAIDNVSFDVFEGELLGLIGPNGTGKTTMLRAITGVVRADAGNITLMGEGLGGLSIDARIRKGLALSQQIVKPFREISVLDNVVLAAGFAKTRSPMGALLNLFPGIANDRLHGPCWRAWVSICMRTRVPPFCRLGY
jgi:branched-chain amino acid transport system ATP-binding protein